MSNPEDLKNLDQIKEKNSPEWILEAIKKLSAKEKSMLVKELQSNESELKQKISSSLNAHFEAAFNKPTKSLSEQDILLLQLRYTVRTGKSMIIDWKRDSVDWKKVINYVLYQKMYPWLPEEFVDWQYERFQQADTKIGALWNEINMLIDPAIKQKLLNLDWYTLRWLLVNGKTEQFQAIQKNVTEYLKIQQIQYQTYQIQQLWKYIDQSQSELKKLNKELDSEKQKLAGQAKQIKEYLKNTDWFDRIYSSKARKAESDADNTFDTYMKSMSSLNEKFEQSEKTQDNIDSAKLQIFLRNYELLTPGSPEAKSFLVSVARNLPYTEVQKLKIKPKWVFLSRDLYGDLIAYRKTLLEKYQAVTTSEQRNSFYSREQRFAQFTDDEKLNLMILKALPWPDRVRSGSNELAIDMWDLQNTSYFWSNDKQKQEAEMAMQDMITNSEPRQKFTKIAKNIESKLAPIMNIVYWENPSTETMVERLRTVCFKLKESWFVDKLNSQVSELQWQIPLIESLVNYLPAGQQFREGYAIQKQFKQLREFSQSLTWEKGSLKQFFDYALDDWKFKDWSFLTWLKNDGIIMLWTISVAVLAALATGGSSLLLSAFAWTVWWSVWGRLTQKWLELYKQAEHLNNKTWLSYTNTTDIELFLTGKMSLDDLRWWLISETATGTATTFAFGQAWKFLGDKLSNLKAGSFQRKFAEFVFPKLKESAMKLPEWMHGWFTKMYLRAAWAYIKETLQETWEEALEQSSEKFFKKLSKETGQWVPGRLWDITTLYFAVAPGKRNLDMNKFKITNDSQSFDASKNSMELKFSYDSKSSDAIKNIQEYMNNRGVADIKIDDNWTITCKTTYKKSDGSDVNCSFIYEASSQSYGIRKSELALSTLKDLNVTFSPENNTYSIDESKLNTFLDAMKNQGQFVHQKKDGSYLLVGHDISMNVVVNNIQKTPDWEISNREFAESPSNVLDMDRLQRDTDSLKDFSEKNTPGLFDKVKYMKIFTELKSILGEIKTQILALKNIPWIASKADHLANTVIGWLMEWSSRAIVMDPAPSAIDYAKNLLVGVAWAWVEVRSLMNTPQVKEYIEGKQSKLWFSKTEFDENINIVDKKFPIEQVQNEPRVQKFMKLAKEKLGLDLKVTQEQAVALMQAHNVWWEAWNLTFSELKQKTEILQSGFTNTPEATKLIRLAIESWVCWGVNLQKIGSALIGGFTNTLKTLKPWMSDVEIGKLFLKADQFLAKIFDLLPSQEYLAKWRLGITNSTDQTWFFANEVLENIGDSVNLDLDNLVNLFGGSLTWLVGIKDKLAILEQYKSLIKVAKEGLLKEDVSKNSTLSDYSRKKEWLKIFESNNVILNSYDSEIIGKAIIAAHKVGANEQWKNPELWAWVYNYTLAQLRQKVKTLYDAINSVNATNKAEIISPQKARLIVESLIRKGICGNPTESLKANTELVPWTNRLQVAPDFDNKVSQILEKVQDPNFLEQFNNPLSAKEKNEYMQRVDHPAFDKEWKMKYESLTVLWDTTWDLKMLVENLYRNWVIDENGQWIGKDSKVVMIWDILWDASQNSIESMMYLNKLRKKAQETWGDIYTIAGNHENYFLSFLASYDLTAGSQNEELDAGNKKQRWILELWKLIPNGETLVKEAFKDKSKQRIFLEQVQKTEKWKIFLEELCSLSLIQYMNWSIMTHTPFNVDTMMPLIQKYETKFQCTRLEALNKINETFQKWLRQLLLNENHNISMQDFTEVRDVFLLDNRNTKNINSDTNVVNSLKTFTSKILVENFVYWHNSGAPIDVGNMSTTGDPMKWQEADSWTTPWKLTIWMNNGLLNFYGVDNASRWYTKWQSYLKLERDWSTKLNGMLSLGGKEINCKWLMKISWINMDDFKNEQIKKIAEWNENYGILLEKYANLFELNDLKESWVQLLDSIVGKFNTWNFMNFLNNYPTATINDLKKPVVQLLLRSSTLIDFQKYHPSLDKIETSTLSVVEALYGSVDLETSEPETIGLINKHKSHVEKIKKELMNKINN